MGLTIDLYANDGSPLGIAPPDIYGRGVGGAELSMMTWAETMAKRGHRVRVYNNPPTPDDYDGVSYANQASFQANEYRDVFVVYRSPNPWIKAANAGVKLFWSCDQYTIGDFAKDVFPHVDRIVCISPFHVNYHKARYGAENGKIGYIDLGVRLGDYPEGVEKIEGRCIFCSVPDRGLQILRVVWPRIKERAPHASLVITSDYTLWGAPPLNHQYRLKWLDQQSANFVGKVPRHELARLQMEAQVHSFPCTYEELFCISAAECQAAGAVPVTSDFGALPTTNEWGRVLVGHPMDGKWQRAFVDNVVGALLADDAPDIAGRARERFDWDAICERWENLIETGEFNAKTG